VIGWNSYGDSPYEFQPITAHIPYEWKILVCSKFSSIVFYITLRTLCCGMLCIDTYG